MVKWEIYSLWPTGTIWRLSHWSTLFQISACCLTAPSNVILWTIADQSSKPPWCIQLRAIWFEMLIISNFDLRLIIINWRLQPHLFKSNGLNEMLSQSSFRRMKFTMYIYCLKHSIVTTAMALQKSGSLCLVIAAHHLRVSRWFIWHVGRQDSVSRNNPAGMTADRNLESGVTLGWHHRH